LVQSFDPFDVVLGHLIDEGYADTQEAALQIMTNMSEDWRDGILDEAAIRYPKKKKGAKDTREYQDSRSPAGMMVSGNSQVSGAGYMRRGGGVQTQTDPNMRQPQQGRMDRDTRDEMEYRKTKLRNR